MKSFVAWLTNEDSSKTTVAKLDGQEGIPAKFCVLTKTFSTLVSRYKIGPIELAR